MPYDIRLAERVREVLRGQKGLAEKRMFGGVCFLVRGHMCCGVAKDLLVVRVGPEDYGRAVAEPHARPMDFTGRPLRGFVYVAPGALRDRASLAA